ncbi:hypothetical protein PVK06_047870 [Gossypium arboreum]|uniref:Uncharacterized protein n=1 Tax=Gossypium arboreum TaxID=29729 RepID=A0ABR0MED3_GOSAR|nr:hypothetical protein PVK06_047870 [Gossypium arboreum]
MALVVGKDKATGSFARTFADIDLDNGNQDSVPIDGDNEEIEEVRTNVSSSGTSKHKRKNVQESVVDEQIKFVGEQLGKIANALEQFTTDKTPHLYEEVMSMEEEGFDDGFLCSVFDYLDFIDLFVEDRYGVIIRVNERDSVGLSNPLLLRIINRQHNRHRNVDERIIAESERVKMKSLEELEFSHEPGEGAYPALTQNMDPLQVDPAQLHPGQQSRFSLLQPPLWLRHVEVHELPTVRLDQPGSNRQLGNRTGLEKDMYNIYKQCDKGSISGDKGSKKKQEAMTGRSKK